MNILLNRGFGFIRRNVIRMLNSEGNIMSTDDTEARIPITITM